MATNAANHDTARETVAAHPATDDHADPQVAPKGHGPTNIRRDAPVLSEVEIVRFWAKVEKSDGCWLWTAAVCSSGYGVIMVGGRKSPRMLRANRIALFLKTGEWRPDRLACHTCDVRLCTRPDHLYYGTERENAGDNADRGAMRRRVEGRRRLINAAPELLACLKEAARDFSIMRMGSRMERWDAAIAAAEEL